LWIYANIDNKEASSKNDTAGAVVRLTRVSVVLFVGLDLEYLH